jgi:hypothetical protein
MTGHGTIYGIWQGHYVLKELSTCDYGMQSVIPIRNVCVLCMCDVTVGKGNFC